MAGGGTDLMYENTQMGSFNFSNLYDFFQTGGAGVMFLKISHVLETVHEYQQQNLSCQRWQVMLFPRKQ